MTKHQTLLVLGASNYQCQVISRAKQRGIRVVVVDWSAENPGHSISDESHVISTTDIDAVLEVAEQSKLDGIISPATDVAVVTQAIVANELGLFGPPPAAAQLLTSKSAFFEHLDEAGYAVPPFEVLTSSRKSFSPPANPCIVKPDDSSGSKGVALIDDPLQVVPAIDRALQYSRSGRAVVQQYEQGFQGTVEGCLVNGEIAFSFVTERHLPPLPVVATAGHTVPSGLSPAQSKRVVDDVRKILTSLSINTTVFDADFVWNADEPKFLELTPRIGGNSLSQLVFYHYGVSLIDIAIDLALTGTVSEIKPQPYAGTSKVVILHSNRGGRLEYELSRLAAACEVDGIKRMVLDWDPGTVVFPFVNGQHRFGEIIAQGRTPDAADLAIERACKEIALRIL
ncbi:ATP-grasp domain-containing protein [Mycobacterium bourgelatii]|uniref:Carbamoyl-phosphate-synthetase n=1 Tax=Mycobacterium bourgelatii TaxID=1273442 RepID=A0A7I9YNY5_MYCBU|nr:ATP-grasp domain-containing protein [Mycobacterium bourgelatii]MCV6974078.1 ATP-grasp domain-containing protein [Mycobacterium bourgelatii]GFG90223.1 carbamoyl-phosphate-synthetase [Mycobacterium bourgelatii]